jgi:hypothetical protein
MITCVDDLQPDPVHAPEYGAEGFRDFFGTQMSLGDYGAPQPTQTYREEFPSWNEGPGESSNWMGGPWGQGFNWNEGAGQSSQQVPTDFGGYGSWTGGYQVPITPTTQPMQDTGTESPGRFANSFLDLNYNPFGDIETEVYLHDIFNL